MMPWQLPARSLGIVEAHVHQHVKESICVGDCVVDNSVGNCAVGGAVGECVVGDSVGDFIIGIFGDCVVGDLQTIALSANPSTTVYMSVNTSVNRSLNRGIRGRRCRRVRR